MLAVSGYKTKKDLKACVGQSLRYVETSLFGSEYTADGNVTVVGPSAYDRRWYATVSMRDGKIAKVS